MPKPKTTALDIEVAVARHFGARANVIVPNVSWGLFAHHEADVVVLRQSGFLDEIEIKVSAADIRRDLGKNGGRGHVRSRLVVRLWFAVPEALAEHPDIPAFAGVLSYRVRVGSDGSHYRSLSAVRAPHRNPDARKLTASEQQTLMRLGCMRVWSLKDALQQRLQQDRYNDIALVSARAADRRHIKFRFGPMAQYCPS